MTDFYRLAIYYNVVNVSFSAIVRSIENRSRQFGNMACLFGEVGFGDLNKVEFGRKKIFSTVQIDCSFTNGRKTDVNHSIQE